MTDNRIRKMLVILANNLGDVIMATPALEGLKGKYPRAHISFLVEQGFEDGILHNPHIDEIISFPRRAFRDMLRNGAWKEGTSALKEILEQIQTQHYDLIINLSQHAYIANIVPLLHAKEITGYHFLREGNDALTGGWPEYLYAIPFARTFNALHAADVYRRIAGVKKHHGGYTVVITDREKKEARAYLQSRGVDLTEKILVFQPGAAFPAKRWPVEHYIALGRLLCRDGWQIICSGAPSEKDHANGIQQEIGEQCFSTAGDTTFRQALVHCSLAQGCVTGDTALMHAAAAMNIKTYALFGTTSPVETGPYGNGHYIFSGGCNDRPCFCDTCTSLLCMKSILPEMLYYCITNDTVPVQPHADIYRTAVGKDGDYSLLTTVKEGCLYYNAVGAALTQKAFGSNVESIDRASEEYKLHEEESQHFITRVIRLEDRLQAYLQEKRAAAIKDFEQAKNDLSSLTGIGSFWTALLNIRLNSIPVLDPVNGVLLSKEICLKTRKQIAAAFS